jgi:phosphoglycolate phosphatase-like HAD superfamily hydrolase
MTGMTPKHLVWDWNGTLLDDLHLVVTATNAAIVGLSGAPVTADEHRRDFCRPVSAYYAKVLGRSLSEHEFARLDELFHESYRTSLAAVTLAKDALDAMSAWAGTQSLLSMWFHRELVPLVSRFGLFERFARVDGLRSELGGGHKSEHLEQHLTELGLDGPDVVLIGDSIDDADAARSVGARCVLYTGGFTDPAKLRAYGVPVADTLRGAVALATLPA